MKNIELLENKEINDKLKEFDNYGGRIDFKIFKLDKKRETFAREMGFIVVSDINDLINSGVVFEYFPGLPIFHSRDLIHWEHLPPAVWPSYDLGEEHCWSGCAAISDQGKPMLNAHAVGLRPALRPQPRCLR